MRRSDQREWIVKIAYQTQLDPELNQIDHLLEAHGLEADEYLVGSLQSLFRNRLAIDERIEANLSKWSLNRIMRIDLAILRTAVNEMCFTGYAPVSVVINESVEMAKKYSDEPSYRFINGVLSSVAKSVDAQPNEC